MKRLLVLWCLLALVEGNASADTSTRVNVVFILADDLGWTDLGCYGNRYIETPHLDRLAQEGMKFTQAYSACTVCSPTRAAVLTGKYPAAMHVTDWIPGHKLENARLLPPDWTRHLPAGEVTVARVLQDAGYATAHIGKWHLGGPEFLPERFGFQTNIAGTHRGSPAGYFSPYKNPKLSDGPKGEFLTDRLAEEAVQFIRKHKDRPFFLYLPHFAVHTPVQGKPDVVEKYQRKFEGKHTGTNPTYAALTESLDDAVGRVMRALDELQLAERTLVIFTSDNGGYLKQTTNAPLRAGKGSSYEGGVRVPLIVRWPGVVPAQSQSGVPVMSIDYFPTILAAAGVMPPANHAVHGQNLLPVLRQQGKLAARPLYWHYPHYHPGQATPYSAIREGDFKLIQFYEDGRYELYNLAQDPGEAKNLADEQPAKVRDLNVKLETWRKGMKVQSPMPNPEYDPRRPSGSRL